MSHSVIKTRLKEPSVLPVAGIEPPLINFTVPDCLDTPDPGPPLTSQRRYWTSDDPPSIKTLHWGLKEHDMPAAYHTYGLPSNRDITVKSLVNPQPKSNFATLLQDAQEADYYTNKKLPLGKTPIRGFHFTEEIRNNPEHAFGVPTVPSETAKEVTMPFNGDREEDPAVHRDYVKVYDDFYPGEQRNRGYKWSEKGLDPHVQKFGETKVTPQLLAGTQMKELIAPPVNDFNGDKTHVAQSQIDDTNKYHSSLLGRVRPLRARHPGMPEDFVYGTPPNPDPESSQSLYPHPYFAPGSDEPDADLGRSLISGRWNNKIVRDNSRDPEMVPCGVPSIRTDIPQPHRVSVTDYQNYGEVPGGKTLIFPFPWVDLGLYETDFLKPITREKLHSIIMTPANPCNLTEEEFDMLCDQAEAHSLDTIDQDEKDAHINSPAYSSTDRAPRLVQTIQQRGGVPFLSIDGFKTEYLKYERWRVDQEYQTRRDREISNSIELTKQKERDFNIDRRRFLLNRYAEQAIALGKKRQVPFLNLGAGGTGSGVMSAERERGSSPGSIERGSGDGAKYLNFAATGVGKV